MRLPLRFVRREKMKAYQVTGNEYVSLPTIHEENGSIEGISCLYMQLKGMLEMKGKNGLISPSLFIDGQQISLNPVWKREHYWIPTFQSNALGILFRCTYLAPVGERGFVIHLEVENNTADAHLISIGVQGSWDETLHTVNESIPLETGKQVKLSGWNHMFVYQQVPGMPMISLAPIVSDDQPFSEIDQGAQWWQDGFQYDIYKKETLLSGQRGQLDVYWGLGYEEVAAAASAKEMLRQGYSALLDRTIQWLSMRETYCDDEHIRTLLNTNRFFAFFFASGRTIDTEELCMMTSRSPRYYVSAAYWDRDSLLWAFPAIVQADHLYSRELLVSIFRRQAKNFGIHSRYIDGTVLESGFELDELCAPVIALERYMNLSKDRTVLKEPDIAFALWSILAKIRSRRHPAIALYSTFLQPTDDMRNYPYLTYDNVLVWKVMKLLGNWLDCPECLDEAAKVQSAIELHCIFSHQGKEIFAWSIDLDGHWDIYDEPPGSLQLLPFYGFCSMDNHVWMNTMSLIRNDDYKLSFAGHTIAEIGCKHAPHPWILSICNSLLSGNKDAALKHLQHTSMDNGVACESVHEDTGECTTGAAFATCAGFLAFALTEMIG